MNLLALFATLLSGFTFPFETRLASAVLRALLLLLHELLDTPPFCKVVESDLIFEVHGVWNGVGGEGRRKVVLARHVSIDACLHRWR